MRGVAQNTRQSISHLKAVSSKVLLALAMISFNNPPLLGTKLFALSLLISSHSTTR
jgi:hypothetical protein